MTNWVTASKGVKLPEGVFYSLSFELIGARHRTLIQSSGALPGGAGAKLAVPMNSTLKVSLLTAPD